MTTEFERGRDGRSTDIESGRGAPVWLASSLNFCSRCGSVLFWDRAAEDRIAIAMGAFDSPTGTRLEKHIFVADKGDYYEIGDGLPQIQRWPQTG